METATVSKSENDTQNALAQALINGWDVEEIEKLTKKGTLTIENIAELRPRSEYTDAELGLTQEEATPSTAVLFPVCASAVVVRNVVWMWSNVFVRGALNTVQGIAGIGKTFLLCAYVAAVSKGGCVQGVNGEMERLQQGRVLFLTGDDDVSTTIVPRLKMFDANLENIYFAPDGFLPPIGSTELEYLIESVKPDVMILDTLQHFTPAKVDLNSANVITNAMQPLKAQAERLNICVVVVQHINKISASGGGGFSVNFGIGSAAVNGIFRSVYTLGRLKDSDGKPGAIRALAPSKTNLVAGDPPCILFELSEDRGFMWAGIDYELTAEMLYDPLRKGREAPERDECANLLKQLLSEGALSASEIRKATDANGFAWATVNRAKKNLNIECWKEKGKGQSSGWVWALQGYHVSGAKRVDNLDNLDAQEYQGYQEYQLNMPDKSDNLVNSANLHISNNGSNGDKNLLSGRI